MNELSVSRIILNNKPIRMRKNVPFKKSDVSSLMMEASKCVIRFAALSFIFLCCINHLFAQVSLVEDINSAEEESYNEFSNLTAGDGRAYYVSEEKFLWTSYLGPDTTEVAEKLGSFNSISNLKLVGSILYFVGDIGSGQELWKSDGTADGTQLVKEIRAGSNGSAINSLTDVNGILYFVANNGGNGRELWKSDGTTSGTVLVKDIYPRTGNSNPAYLTNVGGTLFFSANNGVDGFELWKSDGTANGTIMVKDLKIGSSSSPQMLTNVNGLLYFTADVAGIGRELYKSDGTAAGTVLVKDIRSGAASSGIENMTAVNNLLFFSANDGIYGHELWKSDGSSGGTVLVKDMTPGSNGSHGEIAPKFRIANLTNINGVLFYTAYKNDEYYIWRSDGTTAGTVPIVVALKPGNQQPRPFFTFMEGSVYFFNTTPEAGDLNYDLYRTSLFGNNPPQFIMDLHQYDGFYSPEMVVVRDFRGIDHLYFWGHPFWRGFKLLKYRSEMSEPEVLNDPFVATASSNPHSYLKAHGKAYFIAQETFYESEAVHVTDGTPNGTYPIIHFQHMAGEIEASNTHIYGSGRDWLELRKGRSGFDEIVIADDYESPPAQNLTHVSGNIYYTTSGNTLWKIDGATDVIQLIGRFNAISNLTALGNNLLFRESTVNNGEILWRTNGMPGGTTKYTTIRSSSATPSRYYPAATIRNTHFFVTNDGVHGNEIWRTQGSASSTYMISDINTSDHLYVTEGKEYDIRNITVFRDSLYFNAIDNSGNWSLFKSNGTAAGLRKVTDMLPVQKMVPAGNKLYLFVGDHQNSLSLWVTNGSASGTKLLKVLKPSFQIDAELIDDVLYFYFSGETALYRSDGTACGTFSVDLQGIGGPFHLGAVGKNVLFSGYDFMVGVEPYAYNTLLAPPSPCEETQAASFDLNQPVMSGGEEGAISRHPNPFKNDFVVRVNGNENDEALLEVFSINGKAVDRLDNLKCNTDYNVGASWPSGIYVLKAHTGGKLLVQKIIKQ